MFWYKKALEIEDTADSSYQNYYSNICIGVCYYWLGDLEKANKYNEEGGKINRNDKIYLENKTIYESNQKVHIKL